MKRNLFGQKMLDKRFFIDVFVHTIKLILSKNLTTVNLWITLYGSLVKWHCNIVNNVEIKQIFYAFANLRNKSKMSKFITYTFIENTKYMSSLVSVASSICIYTVLSDNSWTKYWDKILG